MEVDFIYGSERNPCSKTSKDNWFNWMLGKDSRSRCREFLAYVCISFAIFIQVLKCFINFCKLLAIFAIFVDCWQFVNFCNFRQFSQYSSIFQKCYHVEFLSNFHNFPLFYPICRRSKHDKNQCGIINLLQEFTMNIILKQMKMFFTSIADMVQTISSRLSPISNDFPYLNR